MHNSHTTYKQEETSEGKQERVLPLLSIRELAELSDDKVLGFHADKKPFLINRMNWHTHLVFNHWHTMTPPPVPMLPQLSENIRAEKEQDFEPETAELGNPDDPDDTPEADKKYIPDRDGDISNYTL
jgi:hypothetical protein